MSVYQVKEARILPDTAFLCHAEALIALQPARLLRTVYLSTEDDETLAFFSAVTNLSVTSTNVSRSHAAVAIVQGAQALGIDTELADSLVSLTYALQCDAFVGDLSSNWVRLIDELRSTVRCKAHVPFIDPSQPLGIKKLFW